VCRAAGQRSTLTALRGPWPKDTYSKLVKTEDQILSALALLSVSYAQLEPIWCKRLTERSDVMHPAFVRRDRSFCAVQLTGSVDRGLLSPLRPPPAESRVGAGHADDYADFREIGVLPHAKTATKGGRENSDRENRGEFACQGSRRSA